MAKQKVEDRDLVTSREGTTVAFRLAPIEDRALKALVGIEQAELDARGSIYRASAASVLRTLLRASAVAKGVWEPSSAPAVAAPAAMTDNELNATLASARAALPPAHPRHPAQVRAQVLAALTAITATRDGHHKLIDLPTLKAELSGLPSQEINEALKLLEEDRLVTLNIANDPTAVEHPEQGYHVADRGLIYFATLPEPKQKELFPAAIVQKSAPAPTPSAPKRTAKKEFSDDELIGLINQGKDARAFTYAELGAHLGYVSNPGSTIGRIVAGKQKIPVDKRAQLTAYLKEKGL